MLRLTHRDSGARIHCTLVAVSGHVTDSNGVAVPGVQVVSDFRPSGYDAPSEGVALATSDTHGGYAFLVLAGVPTFTIYPPPASGFSNLTLSGTSVLTDFTQTVVLQSTDLVAPVIVSGPLVVHLSDTSVSIRWDTNEPASSLVQFGPDSLAGSASDSAFMTHHALTLPNLLPSTVYSYRVGSVDAYGNGPVNSQVLTFRTQDPPGDITPPVITSGPSVTSLGLDRAVVAWTIDEPATTVVRFGPTAVLGASASAPEFVTAHAMALTGLQPNTVYSCRVESTDPDGNGPASSAVFSFQTAAVADTTPPMILSGPTLLAATDTTLVVSCRYYFTVVSTDVAGNRAQSSEASFVAGAASDPASVPFGAPWVVGLLAVGLAGAGARALRVIEREFDSPSQV